MDAAVWIPPAGRKSTFALFRPELTLSRTAPSRSELPRTVRVARGESRSTVRAGANAFVLAERPRGVWKGAVALDRWIARQRQRGCQPETLVQYRCAVRPALAALARAGRPTDPRRWSVEDARWLRRRFSGQRWRMSVVSRLAGFYRNFVFRDVGLPPLRPSPRVRWLTTEQTEGLLEVSRKDRHLRLVVLLGLAQGLRRGDWVRLRLSDLDLEGGRLRIRVRSGVPPREDWVPMHPSLPDAFRDYLWFRRRRVRRFLRRHPGSSVPEELFLHVAHGALCPYRPHGTDKWVKILERRLAGRGIAVRLSTDMLRRRGAALLVDSLRDLPDADPAETQHALQRFLRTKRSRATRSFLRTLR